MALLTFVPMAVLAYAALVVSPRAVDDEVRSRVGVSAELVARELAVRMGAFRGLVGVVARGPSINGAMQGGAKARDAPALQRAIDLFTKNQPTVARTSVVDPSGRVIATSPPSASLIGHDEGSSDWFREVAQSRTASIAPAFKSPEAGGLLVVGVTSPIPATAGQVAPTHVLGYLNAEYRLDALEQFTRDFERTHAMALTITDQQGVIIATPHPRDGLVSALADPAVVRALAGEAGATSADAAAGRVLVGYAPVPDLGWTVQANVREAAALAPVRRVRAIAIALVAALAAAPVVLYRTWRQRLRAEARERHGARYARSLIEASLDPLVMISADGRITDANEATSEISGAPRDGLIGSDFADYFTDPDAAREGYRQAFADGSVTDCPLTVRHRDGHLSDVLYNASVYRDEAGEVAGVVAAARDVTERKRAERALHDSEARYRGLVESQQELIIRLDREGRCTFANDAFCATCGRARDVVVGEQAFTAIVHPDDLPRAAASIDALHRPPYRSSVELRTLTIDGPRWVAWENCAIRDASGAIVETQAVGRDIDDLKRADADLARRAQELEHANFELGRSNAELEQFAYIASHDLSEPLRAISGPISLIARRYRGKLDDEADEFIEFAVDGCQRMQRMIDHLLVYSRVDRQERSFEPTDCSRVVEAAITALGPTIAETGARVHVDQLPVVMAEATQLAQVFQNLIANALKFVRPGVPPEVFVAAERAGAAWRFSVTDNGIGIAPEHRDRIFVMFKRLHSRDDYPGNGIGLALAKKIVERHGGRIGVEDAPNGTGIRFWFTLPAEGAP